MALARCAQCRQSGLAQDSRRAQPAGDADQHNPNAHPDQPQARIWQVVEAKHEARQAPSNQAGADPGQQPGQSAEHGEFRKQGTAELALLGTQGPQHRQLRSLARQSLTSNGRSRVANEQSRATLRTVIIVDRSTPDLRRCSGLGRRRPRRHLRLMGASGSLRIVPSSSRASRNACSMDFPSFDAIIPR